MVVLATVSQHTGTMIVGFSLISMIIHIMQFGPVKVYTFPENFGLHKKKSNLKIQPIASLLYKTVDIHSSMFLKP